MTLTLGNWVILVIGFVLAILITAYAWSVEDAKAGIITALISFIILILIAVFMNWYNTSTASGIRNYKDYQSELSNGIEREIVITAEDGREIFRYEGKVDIESNHEDNYIKFESAEGKRYIIYYGIQDTIQIIEK